MGETEVFSISAIEVERFDTRHSAYATLAMLALTVVVLAIVLLKGWLVSAGVASTKLVSAAIVLSYVLSMPAFVLAQFGFVVLGVRWGSKFLAYASLSTIVLGLMTYVLPTASEAILILTGKNNAVVDILSYIVTCVVFGIYCTIFGLALIKARKDGLVRVIGFGNIIMGVFYLTVLLSIFGALLNIPVMVLEAYLLYGEGGIGKKNKGRADGVNQAHSTIVRTL